MRSIGEILRDAEAGDLRAVFAADREPYDFVGTTNRLFDLLDERQLDYVLVGGLAMLHFVEGRNTRDIDLIVSPDFLGRVPEVAVSSEDGDFGRGDFSGIQLDLLKTSNAVFDLVRERFTSVIWAGNRELKSATAEGLFILKAYALPSLYRQGEFQRANIYEDDIRELLRAGAIDESSLLKELEPYVLATDIAAVAEVVAEARKRIEASAETQARLNAHPDGQGPEPKD